MKRLFRFLITLFLILFTGVGVAGLGGLTVLYYFARGLPDHHTLETYAPPLASRVFATDGSLVAEYALEKRLFIPIEAVPEKLVRAFLAAEDKNFFLHLGLDPLGILRAVIVNVTHMRQHKRLVGASTITQQVAKNFLLGSEVSLARKIREAILSFRIEQALGKKKILELYLNQIYLGLGSYGVAGAAYAYFSKSLDDLSIAECAYLAALAKGAENYHPLRHPYQAKERRDWVIKRMKDEQWISPQQAEEAMAEPLAIVSPKERAFVKADYFAEEIRRELIDRLSFEKLYTGGFVVQSTLIPSMQKAAEEVLRAGLRAYDRQHGWRGPLVENAHTLSWGEITQKYAAIKGDLPLELARVLEVHAKDVLLEMRGKKGHIPLSELTWARKEQSSGLGPVVKHPRDVLSTGNLIWVGESPQGYTLEQIPEVQGALVALDPWTGHVLALQGGYTFNASQYNRATQAKRQSGSAIKPFVYLAGLLHGLTPTTLFNDAPIAIDLGAQGIWRPKNYGQKFLGTLPMRMGLEKSLNTLTIRVAQKTGIAKIAEVTETFGIFEKMPPHLSMALGAGETTLLRLTVAYGMLANGGRTITPSLISFVQDRCGQVILKNDHRVFNAMHDATEETPPILPDTRKEITDPLSVYQVISMLEGAVERGTARAAKTLGVPIAAKTGTSNDSKDVWCIGFTPNLVVGVFIGFDAPRCLGTRATGGTLAAPIFVDFMKKVLPSYSPTPFKVPRGICFRRINRLTGASPTSATEPDTILEAFKLDEKPVESEDSEKKDIETQSMEEQVPIASSVDNQKAPSDDTDDQLNDLWEEVLPENNSQEDALERPLNEHPDHEDTSDQPQQDTTDDFAHLIDETSEEKSKGKSTCKKTEPNDIEKTLSEDVTSSTQKETPPSTSIPLLY
ncbi:MAG: PBP1A family penicillin-binding protein [Holosporales bacterium]|jgi:penicillin-binding protein 1A|nr:PBP1A family penicillin-binding protein [Holosporales bacterium]